MREDDPVVDCSEVWLLIGTYRQNHPCQRSEVVTVVEEVAKFGTIS